MSTKSYLIKEHLCLTEYVFQLCQLQEVPLESFGILIDFTQLILQFFKSRLNEINLSCRVRNEKKKVGFTYSLCILIVSSGKKSAGGRLLREGFVGDW